MNGPRNVDKLTDEEVEVEWKKLGMGGCLFLVLATIAFPFGLFLGWWFQ